MTVAYQSPDIRGPYAPDGLPLAEGPRYVRSAQQSRWHRVRDAHTQADGVIVYHQWCGQTVFDRTAVAYFPVLARDEILPDEPACGTCVGRAIGAGQDPAPDGMPELVFSPASAKVPSQCPGSRREDLYVQAQAANWRVVMCLACRLLVPGRASGSPYTPIWGPVRHAPGPNLIPPCPWHRWHQVVKVAPDLAGCRCQRPKEAR